MADTNEEFFPLGPGGVGAGGLLQDLLNFALRNARNYANKLPQPGQQLTASDISAINPAANIASGIYRQLGLERQGGSMNPAQFIAKLQQLSNYPRYKQLVENTIRRKLGDSFTGYRGANVGDPLMNVVSKSQLPAVTAITTHQPTAMNFAKQAADAGKAARVAEGEFTPESVLSLLPRRNTGYGDEAELLVDPRWAQSLKTTARAIPPDKSFPHVEFKPQGDELLNMAMRDALDKLNLKTRPIPGSGAVSEAGGHSQTNLEELVSNLKAQLEEASKPPPSGWGSTATPEFSSWIKGKPPQPSLSQDELNKLIEQLKGGPIDAQFMPNWSK